MSILLCGNVFRIQLKHGAADFAILDCKDTHHPGSMFLFKVTKKRSKGSKKNPDYRNTLEFGSKVSVNQDFMIAQFVNDEDLREEANFICGLSLERKRVEVLQCRSDVDVRLVLCRDAFLAIG